MPVRRLREFLDREGIRYLVISHSAAYTAQQIAAMTHVPGREMAKTVMVRIDGRLEMVVLPASQMVDFVRLGEITGAKQVEKAREAEFASQFPDAEPGAMPPFGNLYGMPVWMDETLAEDEEIAFSAGTHTEVIRMRVDDYRRLVKPRLAPLSKMRSLVYS